MPQADSQHHARLDAPYASEASSSSETLFLLSICRDEDDAAALRSDLRRSPLNHYKLQHCANVDDANHLLQVCGFDLVFLRLDDFQDKQAAIDLVRQTDPELAIVAMLSSRLQRSDSFAMPQGIDAHCLLEDLSPSLVASLVSNVLGQKRKDGQLKHLQQELTFAIEAGDLSTWLLDIETARVGLSPTAAKLIDAPEQGQEMLLDDFLDRLYPEDQDRLKRIIDLAIETQGDIETNFRIAAGEKPGATIEFSAKFRPGGPRRNPTLYGYLRRKTQTAEDIQERIESANRAIQQALRLRDDAIQTASKELELLMRKVELIEPASSLSDSPPRREPEAKPALRPDPNNNIKKQMPPPTNNESNQGSGERPESPPPKPDSLSIDSGNAMQNVLKSIARQKKEQSNNTFPFDFSAANQSDYSDPNPHQDGFVGAAKRLVSITQNGHQLGVTLSIENDGTIECEKEKELIFEILKELLTNVVKHARAKECIIALFRDEDDWVLQVEDDGVGLENNLVSISTPLNKIGLFRIRTKLALKGGQLDLTPTFPKGLMARARLPISLNSSQDAERA